DDTRAQGNAEARRLRLDGTVERALEERDVGRAVEQRRFGRSRAHEDGRKVSRGGEPELDPVPGGSPHRTPPGLPAAADGACYPGSEIRRRGLYSDVVARVVLRVHRHEKARARDGTIGGLGDGIGHRLEVEGRSP